MQNTVGGQGRGALITALSAAAIAALAIRTSRQARAAEKRHPPTGRFIEVEGVRLHYLERGDGPPVVFLHGNGAMIEEVASSGFIEAAARTNRVIVFDRPGYGHSTRPRARLWTPQAQARLFRQALDRLGAQRSLVIGHSWGTLVALALALDHPQSVSGLILLGGYYYPTARADVLLLSPPAIPVIGDVLRYTVSPVIGRLAAPGMFKKMFGPLPVPARFSREYPLGLALRPVAIRASAEEAAMMVPAAAALRKRYGELRQPVLLLAGDGDRMADPARQSRRLHRELRHSELKIEPGVGHMVHHAMPVAIAQAARAMSAVLGGAPAPSRLSTREWLSNYRPGADGEVPEDQRIDETTADSFPASDPPSYMGGLRIGEPDRKVEKEEA